jgi:hypothetical protein
VILAVGAQLGIFALAAALGALLLVTVFAGWVWLSAPGPGIALVIDGALVLLLIGGVLLDPAARRSRSTLALHLVGLFAAILLAGGLAALALISVDVTVSFFAFAAVAGVVGTVVAYVLSGLRVAPPPYHRYVNLGCGVASWIVVAALTLTIPDQAFTSVALLGLPYAMLGGLLGGGLRMVVRTLTSRNRLVAVSEVRDERVISDGQAQSGTERNTAPPAIAAVSPASTDGIFWRLLAAFLVGVFAVPFGPDESVTLYISLVILGLFAGIATLLEVSVRGWHPGLLALLCSIAVIPLGFGYVLVHATGDFLFFAKAGGAASVPFASFVAICALLCALAVGSGPSGESRTRTRWGRRLRFWLVIGLLCWMGIAAILLWRGLFSVYHGEDTPGQFSVAEVLPLIWITLPVAPLGAVLGGMLRAALAR